MLSCTRTCTCTGTCFNECIIAHETLVLRQCTDVYPVDIHSDTFKFATMTTTAVRLQLSRRSRIFLTDSSEDLVYESPEYCVNLRGRCKLAIDPESGLLSLFSVKSGKIVHSFFVNGSFATEMF